jgi:hypothetical protein
MNINWAGCVFCFFNSIIYISMLQCCELDETGSEWNPAETFDEHNGGKFGFVKQVISSADESLQNSKVNEVGRALVLDIDFSTISVQNSTVTKEFSAHCCIRIQLSN